MLRPCSAHSRLGGSAPRAGGAAARSLSPGQLRPSSGRRRRSPAIRSRHRCAAAARPATAQRGTARPPAQERPAPVRPAPVRPGSALARGRRLGPRRLSRRPGPRRSGSTWPSAGGRQAPPTAAAWVPESGPVRAPPSALRWGRSWDPRSAPLWDQQSGSRWGGRRRLTGRSRQGLIYRGDRLAVRSGGGRGELGAGRDGAAGPCQLHSVRAVGIRAEGRGRDLSVRARDDHRVLGVRGQMRVPDRPGVALVALAALVIAGRGRLGDRVRYGLGRRLLGRVNRPGFSAATLWVRALG